MKQVAVQVAPTENLLEEKQKPAALVIALQGAELENLQTLSEEDRSTYGALIAAIELRFGDEYLKQVFPA